MKRLFRFSLGTLLIVVTLFGDWLGLKVSQVDRQKKAVAWVREHGGGVSYDYQTDYGGHAVPVHNPGGTPPGPKWLRNLIGDHYFLEPKVVGVQNDDVDSLHPLTHVPTLKTLTVQSKSVVDLSPLAELQELTYLDLNCPEARDLSPLAKLKNLEILYLTNIPVTNERIANLKKALPNCNIIRK